MKNAILEIRKPDDMHLHLRQGEPLQDYVKDTQTFFKKALIMPNITPPIADVETLKAYRAVIQNAAPDLTPLMTFKIIPGMSGFQVEAMIKDGVTVGKLYPEGMTTNSSDGVGNIKDIYPVLEIMQSCNVVLSVHAEAPGSFSMNRECEYLSVIDEISSQFPELRIVIEHISQKETVEYILGKKNNFAATITTHHLLLTLDDILGNKLNPHHFCKPIVKTPGDRDAIRKTAFSGDPRFFFGSDSAPHPREAKESNSGLAGIYSAPVAVPLLAQIFSEAGFQDRLEAFCSQFGSEFYGLELNTETITLEKKPWVVPDMIHGVVPLFAGKEIQWDLA